MKAQVAVVFSISGLDGIQPASGKKPVALGCRVKAPMLSFLAADRECRAMHRPGG